MRIKSNTTCRPDSPAPSGARQWGALFSGLLMALLALSGASPASAAPAGATPNALLAARHAELKTELAHNQFSQPLHITSVETSGEVTGDIYAEMAYPFATVQRAFARPGNWCDMMILHINTKFCLATGSAATPVLEMGIGGKAPEPIDRASRLNLGFRVSNPSPDYFAVALDAGKGPLGTSNYRIRLEALALDDGHTFLHFSYSYEVGVAGRLAMQAYLSTAGLGKVGFTIVSLDAQGAPVYVKGVRGVVERNTMRYYLAIASYLGAPPSTPAAQLERRLETWYDATERYARQLHDIDRDAYLAMKRDEVRRQQTLGS